MNGFFGFSISELIALWLIASIAVGLFLGKFIKAGYGHD